MLLLHKCLCIVFARQALGIAHWAAITNWRFCPNPFALCYDNADYIYIDDGEDDDNDKNGHDDDGATLFHADG